MQDAPMLVACPHCHALNRVPPARLGQSPRCGQCHGALFAGKPVVLRAQDFDRHALRSELPLVVDFWAPWCGPCLAMAPQFEAAASLLEPNTRLAKVDTEAFQGGREIARQPGAMGSAQIVAWVRAHLPRA